MFAVIAAIPPLFLLGLEGGSVARLWATFFRANPELPPAVLALTEVAAVVWAWAIFFGVLALIVATETEPMGRVTTEPEGGDIDTAVADPWALGRTESVQESGSGSAASPGIGVRPEGAPEGGAGGFMPVVPNMPEVEAWASRGGRLYGMGRYEEAIVCFDKVLKLHPRFAPAWAGKGLASNALGRYMDAVRFYDESLRLDARDPAVWYDKGNSLCAISRFEGALQCFNEVLILDPRDAKAWNNKGVCLASLGRHDEAIPCYDRALEIDPSYAVAWRAKAMVEERLGRVQEAVKAFKQYVTLASELDATLVEGVRRHVQWLEASAGQEIQPREPQ